VLAKSYLQFTIGFPAVPYVVDDDLLGLSINPIDDAIVTNANVVQTLRAG
jgi:hypothetical protein